MSWIPFDERTKRQAYPYDTQTFRVKLSMWFWENIGIPLMGRVVKGKTLQFEHIKGEKIKYENCNFKRCKFDGMKLIFITRSTIEHETPIAEFHRMDKCAIKHCVFKKVPPIIGGDQP